MGIVRVFCIRALPGLLLLMFPLFTSVEGRFYSARAQPVFGAAISDNNAHLNRNYDRIEELEKACEPVIDSASELESNDYRAYSIKYNLSFAGGDWEQEAGTHPLLPFLDGVDSNDSDMSSNSTSGSPFKLAYFTITDVDHAHRSRKTVAVNGALNLIISRYGPFPVGGASVEPAPQFQMWSGHTEISIFFQGVYTENGEERVMCLLGNAMLPLREPDSAMNFQPPLSKDDRILLTLHYPKTFTLTQRAIRGEMRSLNLKTHLKYFDKVHISSQLSSSDYHFGSLVEISKACDPSPYSDNFFNGIDMYKGHDFCSIFVEIEREATFIVLPNWNCSGTDEFCSKLGPFATDKETTGTRGGFNDVKLLIQNVHCEQKPVKGNETVARVSLVLRAVPPHDYMASSRTGFGNTTLAAEGIWKSSSGQLCMVGCLAERNACDSRVCFYIPTAFSIKQRGALLGTISSVKAKTRPYFPLSFQFPVRKALMWRFLRYANLRYEYSKLRLAGALLERHEPSTFGNVIKKSLLKFPSSSVSFLAEDLTFHAWAVPDPNPSPGFHAYVRMKILSVGSTFIPYSRVRNFSSDRVASEKAEYTQKQLLVNVSAQLSVSSHSNFSALSLEGLYDRLVGKMYLIGCRIVRAPWKILLESNDLDGGFDCLIEAVVSYPPITAQWLVNPTAEISVTSQRAEDDPLYFKPVKLRTRPIMYRQQREDVLSERGVEGVLRVLTLSVAIACIASQLYYIRREVDSAPFMSLVMLGIEALGYGLPLVTDVETLFKRERAESYELENRQRIHALESTVKLMVLIACLLTLRLVQKVWKSRARFPHPQAPNEKFALVTTLIVHIAGFIYVLSVRASNPLQPRFLTEPNSTQWPNLLLEYTGLVRDLFLFPQIFGNLTWRVECKPLRKLYYIGLTMIRLLPRVYDYFKAPTSIPYFSRDYELVNPDLDFYSRLSDVFVPVVAAILGLLVFVQQRWGYEKLSDALVLGRWRLLPTGPRSYQKLSSESVEAELASVGNGIDARDQGD